MAKKPTTTTKEKDNAELKPEQLVAAAQKSAFADQNPQKAFEHFRSTAEAVDAEGLEVSSGQPLVMRANVLRALEAMQPHWPAVLAKYREPALRELFELPSLLMAFDHAAARVPTRKLSTGEINELLREGAPWRELALTYLEAVSHPLLNLVEAERVRAIREGTGKLDQARDFLSISALFHEKHDALEGKHPFPEEKLVRLGEIGAILVQQIVPRGAHRSETARPPEAILRDKFYRLVTDRYDHLQVLAAVAVGKRKADALLPALRSAQYAQASATEATPAPADPEKK